MIIIFVKNKVKFKCINVVFYFHVCLILISLFYFISSNHKITQDIFHMLISKLANSFFSSMLAFVMYLVY